MRDTPRTKLDGPRAGTHLPQRVPDILGVADAQLAIEVPAPADHLAVAQQRTRVKAPRGDGRGSTSCGSERVDACGRKEVEEGLGGFGMGEGCY